tara:strand:- start:108 stop:668 length:561 start_codon:yes stop_codon:yes gene_type:complete
MAQLSSLILLVRERCGGVLDQMAKDQLGRAYQKFCYESRFLARTQEIEQGQDGALNIDSNHVFVSVDFVLDANGYELKSSDDYTVSPNGTVTVINTTPKVRVFYHIAPQFLLPNDFEADNTIVNRWADAIADGAAANLLMMPNTDWTDLAKSDYYKRRFTDGYRDAFRVAVNALDEQRPSQPRVFY